MEILECMCSLKLKVENLFSVSDFRTSSTGGWVLEGNLIVFFLGGKQAVADGVDVLSLSLAPNSPPPGSISTFLNILDVALLNAVKANVLVVQAAGNGGPHEQTVTSFSPWIISVGAGVDDRSYPNTIVLSDKTVLPGTLLARK